jgi:hypothetical protein
VNKFHKFLWYTFFLIAACALPSFEGARAQQPQQPPAPPRFTFDATTPISLEPGGKASETLLQNNTAGELEVEVKVIDVEPKSPHPLSSVLGFAPQTAKLPPAGSMVIMINPPPASVTEFGQGYLVAVEQGKAFARREIKSRTAAAPTPAPKIVEPSVPLDSFQSINLPGINFLPSFTSRLSPSSPLLLLVLLISFAIWVLKSSGIKSASGKTVVGTLVAALTVTLLGALVGSSGLDGKTLSAVIVPPLSLTSAQPLTSGLIGADGSLGKLQADGFQLKATGLARAGAYEGVLKVPQATLPAEVKVVTNVSDWWPYAFLFITLGVLLGYHLTRYFKQQRGEDEQRVRAAQLWLRVSDQESNFQIGHGGQPYAGYSIAFAAKDWLAAAERSIAAHAADAAKASLDRLDVYVDLFSKFRGQLLTLNTLQESVWELIERDEPQLAQNRDGIRVFSETEEALKGEPLVFSTDEEQQSTTLKAYRSRAQAQLDWLSSLEKMLATVDGYFEMAKAHGWDQGVLKELKNARRAAIMATKQEDVLKAGGEAATAYSNALTTVAGDPEIPGGAALADADFAFDERAAIRARAKSRVRVSELSYSLLATGGDEHDPDSLYVFTASVTLPIAIESYRLQWDFGDGQTSNATVLAHAPGEPVQMQVSHRYGEGGAKKVAVKNSRGDVLDKLNVTVGKGPGRAARLLAAFRLTEWQMSVVTGLIAIGLGFYTLYLSKAIWGTPADYLYAILWGSIVSEGLKYAAGLVNRVWAQ